MGFISVKTEKKRPATLTLLQVAGRKISWRIDYPATSRQVWRQFLYTQDTGSGLKTLHTSTLGLWARFAQDADDVVADMGPKLLKEYEAAKVKS